LGLLRTEGTLVTEAELVHSEIGAILLFLLYLDQSFVLLAVLVRICLLELSIAHLFLQVEGAVWRGSDNRCDLLLASGVDDNGRV
jgi:hypothetical protein